MICACGHGPASHDAPSGPCHECRRCGWDEALHPYTPVNDQPDKWIRNPIAVLLTDFTGRLPELPLAFTQETA